MDTVLYYFSGTGNTLAFTRSLAKELGGADIVEINNKTVTDASKYKKAGILFPVYQWGPPLMVKEFVNKLQLDKNAYIFSVAVYGGMLARALVMLKKMFAARGYMVSAGFGVKLPGNFIPFYNIPSEGKRRAMYENAELAVKKVSATVKETGIHKCDTNLGIFAWVFSDFMYATASKHNRKSDKNYVADEKCNSCEICEKICPAGNISMKNGRPVWNHNCEMCLRCLHLCPEKAIQFGKKTQSRARYHHPEVKLADFMQK